jgi:DNA end-binding protein Ku
MRAIWSGSISFGLVNVPVKLFKATESLSVKFHQIDRKSGARVRNKRVSAKTGREVPFEQIVKGYEFDGNKYVTLDPEELEAVEPNGPRTIDVEEVVDLADIDPRQFDRPYWLAPADDAAAKPYALLNRGLDRKGRVAVGRFVLRTREHLVAIRSIDRALALQTMLFADELIDADEVPGLPVGARVSAQEKRMAEQLLDALSTKWRPAKHHDLYRERVLDLVERKRKGEEIVASPPPEKDDAEVVDLMAVLERSVKEAKGRRTGKRSRRSA